MCCVHRDVSEFAIFTLYGTPTYKWQKNTIGLHCWISHSRRILNEIQVAGAYNVTNRKLAIIFHKASIHRNMKLKKCIVGRHEYVLWIKQMWHYHLSQCRQTHGMSTMTCCILSQDILVLPQCILLCHFLFLNQFCATWVQRQTFQNEGPVWGRGGLKFFWGGWPGPVWKLSLDLCTKCHFMGGGGLKGSWPCYLLGVQAQHLS